MAGCDKKIGNKIETSTGESLVNIYKIDDNRYLQVSELLNISYKNVALDKALKKKEITIEKMINELDYLTALNDGGTKIYKYNGNNNIFGKDIFYLASCKTVSGNNNVRITKNQESIFEICSNN